MFENNLGKNASGIELFNIANLQTVQKSEP